MLKNLRPKVIDTKTASPKSEGMDSNDHARLRQGRDRNLGFQLTDGQFLQPAPMFFTRDGHALYLGDFYRGGAAFLIAGGPSFKKIDKNLLSKPGVLTMSMNNAIKSFRTNLWACVDSPSHFIKSIWLDSTITKFVPFSHAEKTLFDNVEWKDMDKKVGDCPSIIYYRRNEKFNEDQYLIEDTVNWGNHSDWGGGRSVMLAAIRILFHLGIRHLFLLGVDFKMDDENKYHFDQDRHKSSISGNNSTYRKLKERFKALKPKFEEYGLYVYNCNPESNLKVFPYVELNDAVEFATQELPDDLENERTEGLYDKEYREKKEKEKKQVKKALDFARKELDVAKEKVQKYKEEIVEKDLAASEYEPKLRELEQNVKDKRKEFRKKEKKKNKVWYGTEKRPKKDKNKK